MTEKNNNLIQGADKKTVRKKCVIYTRASQNEKRAGNNLERQEKLCREWAKKNNIDVIEVFSDSTSRDGLNQMLGFLILMSKEQKHINFVTVSDITRISRGVGEFSNIKHKIDFFATQIRSADFDFGPEDSGFLVNHDMHLYWSIDSMIQAYDEIVDKRAIRLNENKNGLSRSEF